MPRKPFKIAVLVASIATMSALQVQAQDRYGARPYVNAATAPSAPPTSLRARFLTWPGKIAPTARAPSGIGVGQAGQPAVQARFGASVREDGRTLAAYRAAPVGRDGWRPVALRNASPGLAGTPQAPPASWRAASVYDPAAARGPDSGRGSAAPMPQPVYRPVASTRPDDRVRFYSVHRQYGLQPDPPPIPPQFFSASADLSQPSGPIPAQRLTTASSGGATVTRTVRGTDGSDAEAQP